MLMSYNCAVIGLGQIGCEFDEKLSSSKPLTHTGIILNWNGISNLINKPNQNYQYCYHL